MKNKKNNEETDLYTLKKSIEWDHVFDAIPNPAILLDGSHKILAANKAAMKIDSNMIGKFCFEIFHNTSSPPDGCPCEELIANGHTEPSEMEMEAFGGTFLVSCTPLIIKEGSIERLIHIATEITDQKKAEIALKENRFFLQAVLNSIQDGISVLQTDLTIRHVNNIMNMWYAQNVPLEGKKCYEVYHNKKKPCDPCPTLRCIKTGKTEKDIVPGLPGSPVKWIELFSYPMKDKNTGEINGVVEFVRDISQQRGYEKALRESERKYRTIVSSMSDMIILHNKDNEFIEVHCKEDFPLYMPKEQFLGKKVSEIMPADIAKEFTRLAKKVRKTGKTEIMEYSLKIHGKEQWFQGTLNLSIDNEGIVFAATNITQRKEDELVQKALYNISRAANVTSDFKELIEAIRDYLNPLIETTNFYIALYDEVENIFTLPFYSDERDDISTFKAGKSLTAYVLNSGESLIATEEVQRQLEEEGKVEPVGEDSKIWLGVPLKYQEKTVGVIAVQDYNDANKYADDDRRLLEFVSDEIALALQRHRAKRDMEQSLKEKEVLLQEIHHRVKNNMQIVWGLLDLQSEKYQDDTLDQIIHQCQSRISSMSLIHEMMYQTQDFKKIDMKQYAEKMVESLKSLYMIDTQRILISVTGKSLYLDLNRSIPCGMIINELVSNAMKHAFPSGRKGKVEINFKRHNSQVILRVSDDGVGLPDSVNISNPNSMGLEIVNLLTAQLEGNKMVTKGKNKTVFRISFHGS